MPNTDPANGWSSAAEGAFRHVVDKENTSVEGQEGRKGIHLSPTFSLPVDVESSASLSGGVEMGGNDSSLHMAARGGGQEVSVSQGLTRRTGRHTARSLPAGQPSIVPTPSYVYTSTVNTSNEAILQNPDRALLTHLRLEKKLLEMQIDFLQQTKSSIPETVAFKVSTAKANDEADERNLLARYLQALQKLQLEDKDERKSDNNRLAEKKSRLKSVPEVVGEKKKELKKKVLSAGGGVGGTNTTAPSSRGAKPSASLGAGKKIEPGKKTKEMTTPTAAAASLLRLENEMREYAERAQRRKVELDNILGELKGAVEVFFSSLQAKEKQGVM